MLSTISIVQNNDVYEVSFKYDSNIVALIKSTPRRTYDPDRKMWTIPKEDLGLLLNQFKGTIYENSINIESDEDIDKNETLDPTQIIPDIDISDVDFLVGEGCKPYNHQFDFMKYAIDRQNNELMSGFLLCDEQGLGKGIEVMNLAIYNQTHLNHKRCLVICCMNSSKFHWVNDIEYHTGYEAYILGSRKMSRTPNKLRYDTGTKEKLEDLKTLKMYGEEGGEDLPFFVIMNIEGIRGKVGKKYVIADEIINLIKSGEINMIAIDEIHKNCSSSSVQGKQLMRMKKRTESKCMWIPITGTPIVNKPTDVYLPLKLVDGHTYKDYWSWCQAFCVYGGFGGKEIIGYRNIPQLKMLLQSNMLRRLKDDVLDLPPKIFYTEYVENTNYQKKVYDKILKDIVSDRDSIVKSLNPLSKMMRLRQVNGSPELVDELVDYEDKDYLKLNAKLRRLLELLEEIYDRGEKVIIFSNWVEPLRMIYYYIKQIYHVRCYTGTMKEADRQKQMEQFKEDSRYTVLIGTIAAMGVTHTLTVANNIIFYDEPWTVASFDQCCDRCHRISTTKPVNVYTLITKDTIDEKVDNLLYQKRSVSKYIVDNIDIHSNPDLFDYLVSK